MSEDKKQKKASPFLSGFKSIQSAIMVSFSLLMLVALLVFMVIALDYTEKTVTENATTYSSQIINQVNYDIDSYIDYMKNISGMVVQSRDVQSYLYTKDQSAALEKDQLDRTLALFRSITESRSDISNVVAMSTSGKSIVNDGYTKLNPAVDIKNMDWYQEAMESESGIALSYSHVQNMIKSSYEWVITLCRVLKNQRTNEKAGVFFIDLNYSAISDLCENNKIGKKGYIFILDKEGRVIYHPQQQLIYGGLKSEHIDEIMGTKEDTLIIQDDSNAILYTRSVSEQTGWTVVGKTYMSELLRNSRQTQILYAMVAVFLLFLVLLVSWAIARGITRPVETLKNAMSKVEHGEFAQAEAEVITNNEIGSLTNSFNIMTKRIQELMEANIQEQAQKRKSEMKALQAQINPHFLYNTLDSIIWMAEGKKNEEVVLMTAALAKMLRQSISTQDEEVLILNEIEHVKSYLTIQKMRYQDKLEYDIDVEPDIRGVRIIKLTLQPLVENAIYHGLKYKSTIGHLWIRGYQMAGAVYLEIEDDGDGMTQEELDHILEKHKVNMKNNGVGVYNVQQRLQLYYGTEYGISYISEKGRGTTAIIKIPADGGEKNETN